MGGGDKGRGKLQCLDDFGHGAGPDVSIEMVRVIPDGGGQGAGVGNAHGTIRRNVLNSRNMKSGA